MYIYICIDSAMLCWWFDQRTWRIVDVCQLLRHRREGEGTGEDTGFGAGDTRDLCFSASVTCGLPFGKHTKSYGQSPFLTGKSTIDGYLKSGLPNQKAGLNNKTWGTINGFNHIFHHPTFGIKAAMVGLANACSSYHLGMVFTTNFWQDSVLWMGHH